jgi:hypothetical protein
VCAVACAAEHGKLSIFLQNVSRLQSMLQRLPRQQTHTVTDKDGPLLNETTSISVQSESISAISGCHGPNPGSADERRSSRCGEIDSRHDEPCVKNARSLPHTQSDHAHDDESGQRDAVHATRTVFSRGKKANRPPPTSASATPTAPPPKHHVPSVPSRGRNHYPTKKRAFERRAPA